MRRSLLALLLVGLGFILGATIPTAYGLTDKIYKNLSRFTQIIQILDKEYVVPLDEEKLILGAIQGMLASLDPHTIYMVPEIYKDFKSDISGVFGGIGIEVSVKEGVVTVVAPIDDSPAFRAGLKAGDKIIKIDGKSTKGMNFMDAIHLMRGPKGKKVEITFWREGFEQPSTVSVVREIIKVASVKGELTPDKIAFMRVSAFQENTADSFKKVLKNLQEKAGGTLKGVVIDLRDNPGGPLNEAVALSDLFIANGPIVSTKGRDTKEEVKKAFPGDPYEQIPVTVLINHGSASASEIVAGALQDTKRARLLGVTSFGKGSVQMTQDMSEGYGLKYTVARYYTPKGRSIDGVGLTPDVVVDEALLAKQYPDKNKRPTLIDFQKLKALEALK